MFLRFATRRGRDVCRYVVLAVVLFGSAVRVNAAGPQQDTAQATDQSNQPPNIVMLLVDDLGWADLGCYGADLHRTPNIDRLATQSTRFTNAYAAAPICSPTRASILTGKSPARLNMTIWFEASQRPPANRPLIPPVTVGNLPLSETTLAEVLHSNGYQTLHVGKWHLGEAGFYPEVQGFDVNIGGSHWGAPATFYFPFKGDRRFGGEFRYVPGLRGGKPDDYLTDRLTDEALALLDDTAGRPFLLNMWFHTVHTPIEGKPEIVEHYRDQLQPGMRHQNADYAAMVHSLDENVGRILTNLDELGVSDNTIVVLLSDNGGYTRPFDGQPVTSNSPLRSGKGSLYEGGIRIPLMFRWNEHIPADRTCDESVVTTDLLPTLLELVGIELPQDSVKPLDGVSMAPLLRDPSLSLERDALYFHYPHYYSTTTPVSAIRSGDWKLLEYHEDQHVELYHLKDDLGESRDRSGSDVRQANLLRKKLHDWREAVGAQMPTVNQKYQPGKRSQ